MKRLNFVLIGVLLLNFSVFAQMGGTTQRGKATHEMAAEGIFAAHSSFPLGSTIKVVNTSTGEEINAVVNGRIQASPDRIIDLSYEAWDALGLIESDVVMITYTPAVARPAPPVEPPKVEPAPSAEAADNNDNEMSRIKTSQTLYHLLILDRRNCKAKADLSDLQGIKMIYKFLHGNNGYLVALYASSNEGPIFPVMPDRSRVIVNLISTNLAFIKDYTNSTPFKRFVTNRQAVAQLKKILK